MFWALLALKKPIAKVTGAFCAANGVYTGWIPGYLLLTGSSQLGCRAGLKGNRVLRPRALRAPRRSPWPAGGRDSPHRGRAGPGFGPGPPRERDEQADGGRTMPLYDYACDDCGPFRAWQRMSECTAASECPEMRRARAPGAERALSRRHEPQLAHRSPAQREERPRAAGGQPPAHEGTRREAWRPCRPCPPRPPPSPLGTAVDDRPLAAMQGKGQSR